LAPMTVADPAWVDNWQMPTPRKLSPHVVAGLQARESWKNRDYDAARSQAGEASELALAAGDRPAWWNMTYLKAECLRDEGLIPECMELAKSLAENQLSTEFPSMAARAYTLLAVAQPGRGRRPEAVAAATTAAGLIAGEAEYIYLHIEAQRALIAALAESRRLDEAWAECLLLESLLTELVDEDTAGKAYWVIGNVAFLSGRLPDGGRYHDMAAERLSPSKDVDLWARFNRASAVMRLEAELTDPATLRCIERAELATEVVGGNNRDLLEMSLARAHWHYLTGDMPAAISMLRPLCTEAGILAAQTAGEASFLLGKSLLAHGEQPEALQRFKDAAALFDDAAATERSAQVRDFSAAVEPGNRQVEGISPTATAETAL
jgi:tetratricopeptide (TPR) repeat protein